MRGRHGLLRAALFGLVGLGAVGLLAELLLLEHTDGAWQWAPFAVLAGGLVALGAVAARPGRGTIRVFRGTMALFVATGLSGIWLHFSGNWAFEAELDPAAPVTMRLWESLRGAVPILAPGALVQLGLLGWVATLRHPAHSMTSPASLEGGGAHREDS